MVVFENTLNSYCKRAMEWRYNSSPVRKRWAWE